MNSLRFLKSAVAGLFFTGLILIFGSMASAQVSIGLNFGQEPNCPYGYYDYAPYNCSPYGYYGPEWFHGGRFIGAGHWYHGPRDFHGQVNNHLDPNRGYHGGMPQRGDHASHYGGPNNFRGNEARDGRGHVYNGNNQGGHGNGPGGHSNNQGGHGNNQGDHGNGNQGDNNHQGH